MKRATFLAFSKNPFLSISGTSLLVAMLSCAVVAGAESLAGPPRQAGNGKTSTVQAISKDRLKSPVPDAATSAPLAVLPGATADPHIAVFGTTFCLYPTADMVGWNPTSFHGWTSKDLKHWKDEGVILDLPRDLKWAKGQAWAPAIATKNGKYYFYYSMAREQSFRSISTSRCPMILS
jgi:hypothetical protein